MTRIEELDHLIEMNKQAIEIYSAPPLSAKEIFKEIDRRSIEIWEAGVEKDRILKGGEGGV